MATVASGCEIVTLRGGHLVPLTVLQLGWALEARGLTLELEGDRLAVFPSQLLTDADRAQLREHRDALVNLLRYVETIQ